MKENENVTFFRDETAINKVVDILKKYSYDNLRKIDYFYNSLLEKNTDEKLLKQCYPQFDRIKLIGLRKKKNGNSNYDIYYELDNGQAILLAIDIFKSPPVLINGYPYNKNLKKFIEYLVKRYKNEIF